MPFFLARKRTSGVPRGTKQVETEYERSSPSAFRYYPYSILSLAHYLCTRFYASIVALSIAALEHQSSTMTQREIKTFFPNLKKAKMLPINNPDGALAFKSNYHLLPAEKSFLQGYLAEIPTPIFRGRKQFLINLLPRLKDSDLKTFIGFETKMTNITSPADSLSPIGYAAYVDLLSIISAGFLTSFCMIQSYAAHLGKPYILFNCPVVEETAKTSPVLNIGSDGRQESVEENPVEMKWLQDFHPNDIRIAKFHKPTSMTGWGTANNCHFASGLAAPYKRDFSTPDPNIFNQFARVFFPMMDKSTLDDEIAGLDEYLQWLEKWWREEICNTTQGEWMAHMMKLLLISRELGCQVFACVSNGFYQGCILGGGQWKLQVGKCVYVPVTADLFEKEKESLDPHLGALVAIWKLLGMPADSEPPTSMRVLREVIIGKALAPSVRASISENLPFLSFGSSPSPINASTIKDTFRLLSNHSFKIDEGMYMHHSSFWTLDRFEEVLSRFGPRVPSLQTGSRKYKLCSLAHGPGVTSAVPFSADPPKLLQFRVVPIAQGVLDLKQAFMFGMASMEVDTEIAGSKFVPRGPGARDIWGHLTGFVYDFMSRDEGQGATSGDNKRGREDDDEYEEGEIPTTRKKQKFDPFSVSTE